MNLTYALGVFGALSTLIFIIELLRRGILRERFAALWLFVAVVLVILALFPDILKQLSVLLGVKIPSNLLFVGGGFLLLVVSVQLSYEISALDARSRRLAEEVALLRFEVDQLKRRHGNGN
jgi:hypothetical protein